MDNFTYAFIAVAIISLISLLGVIALAIKINLLRKFTFILVSLAAGTLLGDAFLHLVPELFLESAESGSSIESIAIWILSGIIAFFLLESVLHWQHHHHIDDENADHVHPVGINNLVADALHNLVDGMVIGAAFMVNVEIGIATTIAVMLHEIPQEISDFGVLIHAGFSRAKALLYNFLSALMALVGLAVVVVVGEQTERFTEFMLAIAAGMFIYIALADLLPELKEEKDLKKNLVQLGCVILGIVFMLGLRLYFE